MEPSRLPATPIDAEINPGDALLLDYAYKHQWTSWTWLTPHLLKKFAVAFGPAIQRASLRHAMLAFLASILPSDQFQERYDLYEQSAIRELRRCISRLDVDYGDLFAAYLLLYIQTPGSSAEVIHARGCLDLYKHLKAFKSQPHAAIFTVYAPFVVDRAYTWLATASVTSIDMDGDRLQFIGSSIEERAQNYSGFGDLVGFPSTVTIAAGDNLWDYCYILRSCLARVADQQARNDFVKSINVQRAIQSIKEQYFSSPMQKFIAQTAQSLLDQSREHQMDDAQLSVLSYNHCIHLELSLLDATSIIRALETVEVQNSASEAIYCQKSMTSTNLEDLINLLPIAGLAIQRIANTECITIYDIPS